MTCPPFHTNKRKENREAIRINAAAGLPICHLIGEDCTATSV